MGLGKTVMVLALLESAARRRQRKTGVHRWWSCRDRWCSTGRDEADASRRGCACSTTPAPARDAARPFDELRSGPHHLRNAATRRRRAQGVRVRLRDPRRGAGHQERGNRVGKSRASAAGASSARAERHADREPPRRAVEPVRVPEPRLARHRGRVRGAAAGRARRRGRSRDCSRGRCGRSSCAGRRSRSRRSCRRRRADDPLRAGGARSGSSTTSCASTIGRRCWRPCRRTASAKSKMQVLEALLRLRQAACHPGLVDNHRASESSAKFDVLMPHLMRSSRKAQGARVLPVHEPARAAARPSGRRGRRLRVSRRPDAGSCVSRSSGFRNGPRCPSVPDQPEGGRARPNLTAAEYVFLLDPWWNPAVEAQAIDRAHRIGQTRTCSRTG